MKWLYSLGYALGFDRERDRQAMTEELSDDNLAALLDRWSTDA